MGSNFLRIERRRPLMDARIFHLQRSRRGEPQTGCASFTRYSGNSPLCTISSLVFGRRQIVPKEAYYGTYVYDIGDDRVHDAIEMFREWKSAKCINKDTLAPGRFNVGYDKGYKEWLKKDIQNISFQTPRSFRSVMDREAKAVAELQEIKEEAKEVYAKFVENQDVLERATREFERLRHGYDDFDNWIQ